MHNVVGIDFGDSYSCVSIVKNGISEVVADSQGERQIPSIVGFYPDVAALVGREAERRFARFWQSTVFDLKFLLARPLNDAQTLKHKWGFKLSAGKRGFATIEVDNGGNIEKYAPQQIITKILSKLKETAEEATHQRVEQACICIPVDMSNEAREALDEAAKASGLHSVSYISDPVAAAIAYDQDKVEPSEPPTKQLIVVDFGAKFNVTLLKIHSGLIQVVKTETASQLTAFAIERELMNHFGSEFKRKTGFDYTESRKAFYKLQSECERVKKDLSQMQQSSIQIDSLHEGCDLNSSVTRARFEALTDNILKSILGPIQSIVNEVGGIEQINAVILSGGNIKIPKVQHYIRQFFGPSMKILSTIDPCDVNAKGAATQAALIGARNPMLKPKRLIPTCPLSIGLASSDGKFVPVIPIDTILPVKIIKTFGISEGQSKVLVSVYEGEDPVAVNNNLLGQFTFNCDSSRGNTIQIAFLVDHNAVLKVSSKTGVFKVDGVKKRQTTEEVQQQREQRNKQ